MVSSPHPSGIAQCLAPLATKYLAVPGANGTIERVWGDGRRILTFNRHSLSGEQVCQLLRLKFNMETLEMWPLKQLAL